MSQANSIHSQQQVVVQVSAAQNPHGSNASGSAPGSAVANINPAQAAATRQLHRAQVLDRVLSGMKHPVAQNAGATIFSALTALTPLVSVGEANKITGGVALAGLVLGGVATAALAKNYANQDNPSFAKNAGQWLPRVLPAATAIPFLIAGMATHASFGGLLGGAIVGAVAGGVGGGFVQYLSRPADMSNTEKLKELLPFIKESAQLIGALGLTDVNTLLGLTAFFGLLVVHGIAQFKAHNPTVAARQDVADASGAQQQVANAAPPVANVQVEAPQDVAIEIAGDSALASSSRPSGAPQQVLGRSPSAPSLYTWVNDDEDYLASVTEGNPLALADPNYTYDGGDLSAGPAFRTDAFAEQVESVATSPQSPQFNRQYDLAATQSLPTSGAPAGYEVDATQSLPARLQQAPQSQDQISSGMIDRLAAQSSMAEAPGRSSSQVSPETASADHQLHITSAPTHSGVIS